MTETEFRRLAQTYGAEIARWPDHVRAPAEAVSGKAWAAAILHEAAALDDLLSLPDPVVDPRRGDHAIAAVNVRIAAGIEPVHRFAWWRGFAGPPLGMAAAGLTGAVLGFSGVVWPGTGGDGLVGLLAAVMSYSDPSFFVMGG